MVEVYLFVDFEKRSPEAADLVAGFRLLVVLAFAGSLALDFVEVPYAGNLQGASLEGCVFLELGWLVVAGPAWYGNQVEQLETAW